jgi:hypothetical protein
MNNLPLCKCGCGNTVESKRRKYFADHFKQVWFKAQSEKVIEVDSRRKEIIAEPEVNPKELYHKNLKNNTFTTYLFR